MGYKFRKQWRTQWMEKGRRRSKMFPNKALMEKFEAKLKLEQVEPAPKLTSKASMTFLDFAALWLSDYCRVEKAESQWDGDEAVIQKYMVPAFGCIRLKDLGRSDLEKLKQEMRKMTVGNKQKPLKGKTINNVLGLAKKMLNTAVDWEILPISPFVGVKPLKLSQQVFDYWTLKELDHFVNFARHEDPEFVKAVTVSFHTGMRLGELAALERAEVDLERRMIRVRFS